MKSLNGHGVDMEQSPTVETYWVVDVFGQNDKIKVSLFQFCSLSTPTSLPSSSGRADRCGKQNVTRF
jgi:hypothetical protein